MKLPITRHLSRSIMNNIYKKSNSIAIKTVHDETVVFIMDSWSGNLEDEIFILNETGQFILEHIDGTKTLKEISEKLFSEIEGDDISQEEIDKDVISFTEKLLKRHIIVNATSPQRDEGFWHSSIKS